MTRVLHDFPVQHVQNARDVNHHDLARVLDERRLWLHVDLQYRTITATASTPQPDVAVMDINPSGLRMATHEPVPVNTVFLSFVTLNDGQRVRAAARVIESQPQPPDGHDGGFVSTLRFV